MSDQPPAAETPHVDGSAEKPDPAAEYAATSTLRHLRASLIATFRDKLYIHIVFLGLGFAPALLFSRLAISHPSRSYRLLRRLLSLLSFVYYPALSFSASLAVSTLLFVQRQTRAIDALLRSLCDAVTKPVLSRLPSGGARLEEVHERVRKSADNVLNGEKGDGAGRFASRMVLKIALKAVTWAAGVRLEKAAAQGAGRFVTAAGVADVMGSGLVGAVMGPVKKTVSLYLVGVVAGAAAMFVVPLWAVK